MLGPGLPSCSPSAFDAGTAEQSLWGGDDLNEMHSFMFPAGSTVLSDFKVRRQHRCCILSAERSDGVCVFSVTEDEKRVR